MCSETRLPCGYCRRQGFSGHRSLLLFGSFIDYKGTQPSSALSSRLPSLEPHSLGLSSLARPGRLTEESVRHADCARRAHMHRPPVRRDAHARPWDKSRSFRSSSAKPPLGSLDATAALGGRFGDRPRAIRPQIQFGAQLGRLVVAAAGSGELQRQTRWPLVTSQRAEHRTIPARNFNDVAYPVASRWHRRNA